VGVQVEHPYRSAVYENLSGVLLNAYLIEKLSVGTTMPHGDKSDSILKQLWRAMMIVKNEGHLGAPSNLTGLLNYQQRINIFSRRGEIFHDPAGPPTAASPLLRGVFWMLVSGRNGLRNLLRAASLRLHNLFERHADAAGQRHNLLPGLGYGLLLAHFYLLVNLRLQIAELGQRKFAKFGHAISSTLNVSLVVIEGFKAHRLISSSAHQLMVLPH
jgi:hypothetical protein